MEAASDQTEMKNLDENKEKSKMQVFKGEQTVRGQRSGVRDALCFTRGNRVKPCLLNRQLLSFVSY